MFTGIIEKTGMVESITPKPQAHRLVVKLDDDLNQTKCGDSISINGVCLTVTAVKKKQLVFDITQATLRTTSFKNLKNKSIVNIEKALQVKSRLEGHFVLGHIDCARKIKSIEKTKNPYIDISMENSDKPYIVNKGAIAIEGISLTVAKVNHNSFRSYIIPYTLENTNLRHKKTGDLVNLEFDVLGKYIHNFINKKSIDSSSITDEFLKNKGFV